MLALKQFFRCRPFLGSLAVAATLYLISNLLASDWILVIGGVAVVLLGVLASLWIPAIFRRPVRGFFDRYPLLGNVVGLMFAAGMAAVAISKIYGALVNGMIYDGKGHVLTFGANPITFTLWVGGSLLFLLFLFAFLGFAAWAYREERRSDRRFRNRPPLDHAIRRSIDQR